MPMIEDYVVRSRGYLTSDELNQVFTISEMTPGPFSLNAATFVGGKVAGIYGAIATTIAFVLPPIIIVIILTVVYESFRENKFFKNIFMILNTCIIATLTATAINIICAAVFKTNGDMLVANFDVKAFILFGIFSLSLFGIKGHKLSPTYVILASAVAGVLLY